MTARTPSEAEVEAAAEGMHTLWCPTCQPWEANSDDHKNYCRKSARAALTAAYAVAEPDPRLDAAGKVG